MSKSIGIMEQPREGMPHAVWSMDDIDAVAAFLVELGRCDAQTAYGTGPGSEFCGAPLPCDDHQGA